MVLRLPTALMFLLLAPLPAMSPATASEPTAPKPAAPKPAAPEPAAPLPAETPSSRIRVEEAWARPTPPAAAVAAVYLRLRNLGSADRLLRLASPLAGRVELHQTRSEGGMMSMRPVPSADVAAGGELVAEPGGLHVMMLQLKRPLAAGEEFPLSLVFATAGEVQVKVKVRAAP